MENIGIIVSTISAVASAIAAVFSVSVAFKALKNSDKTIADNLEARKVSESLSEVMLVLEIEAQMNERKSAWDKSTQNVRMSEERKEAEEIMKIICDYHETTKENYFNSLERMCFCILKGYAAEKDWKVEYRTILQHTIKECEEDFGESSPYRNIKDLNNKWQRE